MKNREIKFQRICSFILIAALFLGIGVLLFPKMVGAAATVHRVNDDTIFDAAYGYTFKYLDGKTQIETFGGEESNPYYGVSGKNPHAINITGDGQKGKVGAIWRNTGVYKGAMVDLRLTVTDWKLLKDFKCTDGSVISTSQVCFTLTQVGDLHKTNMSQVKVKYEFLNHDTGEAMSVKGHATLSDIDFTQGFQFHEGVESVFVMENNSWLTISGNEITSKSTGLDEWDKDGWVSLYFDGSSIALTFTDTPDEKYIFENSYGLAYQYFGFTPYMLAGFDTPEILKNVDRDQIYGTEEFCYTIEIQVPAEMKGHYYTKFFVTDTLADCLEVESLERIKIANDTGDDVSDMFEVSVDGQQITVSARNTADDEFYNKNYFIKVPVHRKAGYDMTPWLDESGKYIINNQAQVTTDRGKKESPLVPVYEILPELVIEKSVERYEWKCGEAVSYTVNVTQVKEGAIAKNVKVSDISLPDVLEVEDITQIQVTGGKDTKIEKTGNGWTVTATELGENESIRVEFHAIAKEEAIGNAITNTATAICDDSKEVSDHAVIWVNDPELEITKTADKTIYRTNDIINYQIQVRQLREGCVARNIRITDEILQQGVSFIGGSVAVMQQNGTVLSGMELNIMENNFTLLTGRNLVNGDNPADIQGDEKLIITYSVKVNDVALAGKIIQNVAVADCDEEKPVSTEFILGVKEAKIKLEKTSDKETYYVGDTAKYTITAVQTQEDAIAENVVIIDKLTTKGAEILKDSITVKDGSGKKIKGVEIQYEKTGYTVLTHRNLGTGDQIIITYHVLMKEKTLAGKTVQNIVKAKADNIKKEVEKEHKISVISKENAPTETKAENNDTKGVSSVKTEDASSPHIWIAILLTSIAVFLVILRKRDRIFHMFQK